MVHTETLEELELLLCTAEEVLDEYELHLGEWAPFTYKHLALPGQSSELCVTAVIKSRSIPPAIPPHFDIQVAACLGNDVIPPTAAQERVARVGCGIGVVL